MALTDEDLKALRLLMREEMQPFREDVNERFREVDARFERLYAQNDKREQEYLFIKEQLSRQDLQLTDISKELRRHTQYFDDLDTRVTALESKVA